MQKKYYKKSNYKGSQPRNNFKRRGGRRYGGGNSRFTEQDLVNAIKSNQNTSNQEEQRTPQVVTKSFSDFNFGNILKANIERCGFKKPTPIQEQAIPSVQKGMDLIGIANTGTGKTAAFLLPLIDKTFKDRTQKVLIITPTRELAAQIEKEFRIFSKGMGIYSALLIGGQSTYMQTKALKNSPGFVIGTPGRIKDLAQKSIIDLSSFNNVVLDEADRMVDIGFINEIKYFISKLSPNRQSLFTSATMPRKVEEILQAFINKGNVKTVSVATQVTTKNIDQKIIKIGRNEKKIEILHDLLINEKVHKTIVFGNTKRNIDYLTKELRHRGFNANSIHGDKRQSQRKRILSTFMNNELNILLATNVAARGLDIDDVTHVINYDAPESYDEYIHRIGRTARAGKSGTAITFIRA